MKEKLPLEIQNLLSERDMKAADLKERICPDSDCERPSIFLPKVNRSAECLKSKTGALYCFLDDELLMIALDFENDQELEGQHDLKKLLAALGPPAAVLESVMPIGFAEYVYPDYGIAVCGNEPENYFASVEIFPPMSLAKYKRYIWNDPSEYDSEPRR